MSDTAPAEAPVVEPNAYEVAGRDLYRALESMYVWTDGPYPSPYAQEPFSRYRRDGGSWEEGENNADRFTRGNVTLLAHPKCTVRGVLEQSERDPSSYTLYVAHTIIDLESYLMAYQDISLRSYELKGSGELINIMTLADVLSLNGTPTKDLPEGVNGILVHRKGGIALGDVHKYEVTEGEEQAWFEDSIRLAASVTRNIDRIGLPRGEFRKKYGSSHQSGSGALSRLARTAVSKAAGLLRPSGRE